jgi:hypothetical protein
MSAILKGLIVDEMTAQGFKITPANEKLATAIANAVKTYLDANVEASVSGGSSSGSHKLVAS